MSIKLNDLDAARVDFSESAPGNRLPLIPRSRRNLRDDFSAPMKIGVCGLAQTIKVPRSRLDDIALGHRRPLDKSDRRAGALLGHCRSPAS